MQEVFEKIIDGLDRRIEIQTELIQKTEDEMQKYGFQKALEAYQQTRLFIETIREDCNNGWIPVTERLPEDDKYIMVSFKNFTLPDIGRYEVDKDGNGAFYMGDEDKSYASYDLYVNTWMPLPDPYRESEE